MQSRGREVSIPGFTAEASLRLTGGCYRRLASGTTATAMQAVTPALPRFGCAIACAVCDAVGGVGPVCWRCRNCKILGDF